MNLQVRHLEIIRNEDLQTLPFQLYEMFIVAMTDKWTDMSSDQLIKALDIFCDINHLGEWRTKA